MTQAATAANVIPTRETAAAVVSVHAFANMLT